MNTRGRARIYTTGEVGWTTFIKFYRELFEISISLLSTFPSYTLPIETDNFTQSAIRAGARAYVRR